jgi:undecaprenyl-diphosphatase
VLLAAANHLTWVQSIVIGLLQGVTELFPVSSLGHSVLVPAIFGWQNLVKGQSANESFYLAFLVGLHVATALALLAFFWRDWIRIVRGGFRTLSTRKVETSDERLFWLLVIATIPVGVLGLALEHKLRTVFAKPTAAAIFLFVNGLVLLGGEVLRRRDNIRTLARTSAGASAAPVDSAVDGPSRRLETLGYGEGFIIGLFQSLALLAGISRSGVTMVGGLIRGLDHEDAARFSFLAATPVILAAGVYKAHDLWGPNGDGVRGQILLGSLLAAIGAYVSVRFLVRYFETRTLTPFAIYCLVAGGVCAIGFGTGIF